MTLDTKAIEAELEELEEILAREKNKINLLFDTLNRREEQIGKLLARAKELEEEKLALQATISSMQGRYL